MEPGFIKRCQYETLQFSQMEWTEILLAIEFLARLQLQTNSHLPSQSSTSRSLQSLSSDKSNSDLSLSTNQPSESNQIKPNQTKWNQMKLAEEKRNSYEEHKKSNEAWKNNSRRVTRPCQSSKLRASCYSQETINLFRCEFGLSTVCKTRLELYKRWPGRCKRRSSDPIHIGQEEEKRRGESLVCSLVNREGALCRLIAGCCTVFAL